MKSVMFPLLVLALILMAPFLGTRPSLHESEYLWMTVYTHEPAAHTLQPGEHTFQYNFTYSSPRDGSLEGKLHKVKVTDDAPLYRGYVLLRPNGVQAIVDTRDGVECKMVKQINPRQQVRFMVAWVADERLTVSQLEDHLHSMDATVKIDGQPVEPLVHRGSYISWEPLWNCDPWAIGGNVLASTDPGI